MDGQNIRDRVENQLQEFRDEVSSWFDNRADSDTSRDWENEFRTRRREIEDEVDQQSSNLSDDMEQTWKDFKISVKDQLDKLQNRAEELWN